MDISQITQPAVRGTGLVAPLASTRTVAVEQAKDLSFLGVAPTTVDLSSSGRFLSLASLFQKKTLDLQTSVRANADTSAALADAAVAAAAVAGAFDELQTSAVDSNGLPTDTLNGQSLPAQFFQQFGGTPEEAEASLAAIGLRLTAAADSSASELTLDDTVLQAAFRQDPGATSAQLERAAGAFLGVVSTQIQSQVANLSFLDDDSAFASTLPVVDLLPQEPATAPETPTAQQASFADNLFRQNLVAENARNEDPLADQAASGTASGTGAASGNASPLAPAATDVSANLIAASQAEPPLQGARVALPPEPADAQAPAANATPAELRQNPLPPAPAAARTEAPFQAPATTATPAAATTATPATATLPAPDTTASNTLSVAQEARVLAQQLQAERTAAQALDEKIAGASDAVRAALADDIARRDASRVEQRELDRTLLLQRADQLEPADAAPLAPAPLARPASPVPASAAAASAGEPQDTAQASAAQPAAIPAPAQAQQAARDPAIAAAIAAYNVNSGPFAAQNGRPDLQPPRARPVAPVAAVTKVDPAAAIGTPGDGSAPLR